MKLWIILSAVVRRYADLGWAEARWGVRQGLAKTDLLVDLAGERLLRGSDNEDEIRLAGLRPDEAWLIDTYLDRLVPQQPEAELRRLWLYLLLRWVFDNRDDIPEPLAEVERIHAAVGYPDEIAHFVGWLPPTDGFHPRRYSLAENKARLLLKWQAWLDAAALERHPHGA